MDIEGKHGYLSDIEKEATGLPSPVLLSAIDTDHLSLQLDSRQLRLEALQAADDDELTHKQRDSIPEETINLAFDRRIIETIAGQLLAHQVEVSIQNL